MRLSGVLNKPKTAQYEPVEIFIKNAIYVDDFQGNETESISVLSPGDFIELDIGKVMLNFFCDECGDIRTFTSEETLHCLIINKELISVDCFLECPGCKTKIQVWFLVESKDIFSQEPEARILKRTDRLCEKVTLLTKGRYGNYTELLEKATRASREGFGAGSIIYLRKVFEQVTTQVAIASNISSTITNKDNIEQRKSFKRLLTEVDEKCAIIPAEFSNNGYKLFGKLSDVVHGEYDEEIALEKFSAFYRLVTGVIDNVKNKSEFKEAMSSLGLIDGGEANEQA